MLPRILLVNNYLVEEKIRQLEASLASNGASVTVIESADSTPKRFNEYDGVVLSGSPAMLSDPGSEAPYSGEIEAIKQSKAPVLGICFGHQLMGRAFGSRVIRGAEEIKRYVETEILVKDPLFARLPRIISVFESHYEVVETLPKDFVLLARSPTSQIAAMGHNALPLIGVQFHPERNSQPMPDGNVLVGNFVRACSRRTIIAR